MIKNKKPLIDNEYYPFPLGKIKPLGWLKDQMEIQAKGMTGQLPDHWEPLGADSGWLGGNGESWERGPYYLDGLIPLAYMLEDEALIKKAEPWITWTLASQQENGMFGPTNNDDWWPRMVMLKVLMQYEEVTGDKRVIPFMLKYFRYQYQHIDKKPLRDWGQARAGDNMISVIWLYNRTEEAFLLKLLEKLHKQSTDWSNIFLKFPFWRYQKKFDHRVHIVNIAMGLKEPALYFLYSGEKKYAQASAQGIKSLMLYHGQLHGMFSGDEWLAGTSPSQGTELCAVTEYMYTLEQLYAVSGMTELYDTLERVAFNALPATIDKDWMSHQYVQQVNQISCTSDRRNWTENRDDANMFGLEPNFGCCTSNMHQGWPKLAANLWYRNKEGAYIAASYAPCKVETEEGGFFTVEGEYPFTESVNITYRGQKQQMTMHLRKPGWCHGMTVEHMGNIRAVEQEAYIISSVFEDGDIIQVNLPMEIRTEDRANGAVGILRGPLLYSIPLKENWVRRSGSLPFIDYEVFAAEGEKWNYGLSLKESEKMSVEVREILKQPFHWEQSPVRLKVKASVTSLWKEENNCAGELPLSPVPQTETMQEIWMYPYGGCRLRVTELPVLCDGKEGEIQ